MKKIYRITCFLFLLTGLAMPLKTAAQNEEDISSFLMAGQDASKLIEAYMKPAVKSLSYGMTGGWYTTAKAHKTLGFDLSISLNAAFMPTSENFFDPNKLGLSENTTYDGARDDESGDPFDPTRKAPTIFGPKDETQYTTYEPTSGETFVFRGPEGFDMKKEVGVAAAPMPMIQLGIGIIKNTDVKIRFIPKQTVGASEVKMFGVGVMHDIKQHINGIKLMPFDLSALVAYNSFSGTSDLSNSSPDNGPVSDNGELTYKFNSWVIQALISKKLSVLTGYAGVGYNIVNTQVDVKGDYTVYSEDDVPLTLPSDPIAIDFKNNSFRFTVGMRLKLGPVFFNGDYTFQKFNTLSVGFGLAVR